MVSACILPKTLLSKNSFSASRKALRKRIAADGSKTINRQALARFMGNHSDVVVARQNDPKASPKEGHQTMCPISSDVPDLPALFQPRDGPLRALIASLSGDSATRRNNTTVTAQGMASVF
jgi:hypothetical protein